MPCKDLREFIALLEKEGDLKRISIEVDPVLEVTEISDRTLRANGPALLFENLKGSDYPMLANLFGHPRRVALAMGQKGRLPPTMELNKINKVNSIQEKCLAFFKKSEKPITAYSLQEALGIKEIRNARNYIQRLVREGHIKRVNKSHNIVFAEYILK